MKKCIKCGEVKALTEFRKSGVYFRGECKTCEKAVTVKYRAENPEKEKARNAKYRAENPEKRRAINAKWQAENPEKRRASVAKWQAANPEKVKAAAAKCTQGLPPAILKKYLTRQGFAPEDLEAYPELLNLKKSEILLKRAIKQK